MCHLVSPSEPLFSHLQNGGPDTFAELLQQEAWGPGRALSTVTRPQKNAIYGSYFYFFLQKLSPNSLDYSSKESISQFQEQGTGKQSWFCPGSDINKLDGPEARCTHFPAAQPRRRRGAHAAHTGSPLPGSDLLYNQRHASLQILQIHPHRGIVLGHKKE